MSLPIDTLEELVAPLSIDDFRAMFSARKPLHMPGDTTRAERYADLFNWNLLVGGVRDGTFPAGDLRLSRDRSNLPRIMLSKDPGERADLVERLLAANASVMVNYVQATVPALGKLCEAVARETRDHVSAVAIATTGPGGALKVHWDEYDIIVLQVEGAKHWRVYRDPVVNPVYGLNCKIDEERLVPALEVVLEPGDWLYVPAGWAHQCDTTSARSLHLGIMFYPFNAVRAVELVMDSMLADAHNRAPIRFDKADAAVTEAALRNLLVSRIEAMPIDELLRLHQAGPDPRLTHGGGARAAQG